jgi:hypothetical protein
MTTRRDVRGVEHSRGHDVIGLGRGCRGRAIVGVDDEDSTGSGRKQEV